MSEKIEIFRRTLAAFDRRDRDTWLASYHEDYELIPSATWPEADPVIGAEAGWEFYLGVTEQFESRAYAEEVEATDIAPDKILIHQHSRVRGIASGADVDLDYWVVITFREGKIVRDEWFSDRAAAIAAAT